MRIKLIAIIAVLFLGCSKNGEVPAYIKMTDFVVNTEVGEGSSSDKITDAWVFVNGQSLGAYQLPSEVPIIADGPTLLDIFPVVKENGVLANSTIYPFYTKLSGTYNLVPTETLELDLETTYSGNIEFAIQEDFEGGHFFTDEIDGDRNTEIQLANNDVFEGSNSGVIELNEENPVIEAGWHEAFIPERSELVWVELNYKTNIPFIIGVKGAKDGASVSDYSTFINTKNEWNKIYFNFTSIIDPSFLDVAQFVIVGAWSEDLGVETAEIRIDNFKLIRLR